MNHTLLVSESIFCDFEFNEEIRSQYFKPWLSSIRQLARLNVPPQTAVHFVLYLSDDKTKEIAAIQNLINEIQGETAATFKLILYTHPPAGYGYDDAKHPDLLKNPNKVAPNRDRLFEKAMADVDVESFDRLIRMTLDDDDFLLEWQLDEIVRASDSAYDPQKIVAVGLPNQIVSYMKPHTADIVTMTHNLNGGKFYISSTALYARQRLLSPWSIPEYFNDKNVARMSKLGVSLVTVQDNIPGLIYCRWGHNLSIYDKSGYYTDQFHRIEFGSEDSMIPELEAVIRESRSQFRIPSKSVIVHTVSPSDTSKRTKKSLLSAYRIWVPGKDFGSSNRFVAVFRDSSGGTTASNLSHTESRFIGSIPSLNQITRDHVGYLQLRNSNGTREQISKRAKIRFVDLIARFSLNELLKPVTNFSDSELEIFNNALGMLLWIDSPTSREHLFGLVRNVSGTEEIASSNSLLQYAYEITRNAPNKFVESVFTYLWSYQLVNEYSTSTLKGSSPSTKAVSEFPSAWANFSHIWDSIEQFEETFEKEGYSGIHRISTDAYPIDFEIEGETKKPLVVVLHGRKGPEVKLPYLPGKGLTADLEVSRMSISDPSLYIDPSLSISWFTGNSQQPDLQDTLVRLVQSVAAKMKASKVIFVGGSAGGFASMALSRALNNSIAIVWNPQTVVFEYHKKFVNEYMAHCWPGGLNSIPQSVVTSVIEQYRHTDSQNLVLYLQEDSDNHHVSNHLLPFESALTGSSRILTYKEHWGEGHAPAPKPLLKQIISACIEENSEASIQKLGFQAL